MINVNFYLKNKIIDDDKLIVLKDLIEFFHNDNAKIDELSVIEEKLDSLKDDLDSSFLSLIYQKIDLIKKDNELNLIFSFICGDFKNYNEFSKEIGLNVKELRSIIETRVNNESLKEKLNEIEKLEQNYRKNKFKLYDEFLWIYLNSRYHASLVKKMTGVSSSEFLNGIDEDKLRWNYPENIDEIIENKIDFLSKLRISRVSDFIPIRDMELIKIVSEDVLKVSSKDYKKLEVVLDYLKCYGNVEKMTNNYRYNQEIVYFIINSVMMSGLLNYGTYEKIKNYDLINTDLRLLSVRERKLFVKNMLIKYYKCNGNIVKLIESGECEETVFRLLYDSIVSVILDGREYGKVLASLKEYSEKEEVLKVMRKIKEPVVVYDNK